MAVETWGVDAAAVLKHVGTHTPALSEDTEETVDAHILDAAGVVNLRIRQWTGMEPATLAALTTEAALDVQAAVSKYIKDAAASAWLQPRNSEAANTYREKADAGLTSMRYSIPEARVALAPQVGPPRTDGRSTPPPSWLDVPDGEAFG